MAKHRRIKSRRIKSKLDPIPHNNRGHASGRLSRTQIIVFKDKDDPTKMKQKTIYHMNLSPYEQRRIHIIKVAIAENDTEIMKKLNPRERKLYDNMLKEKQLREGGGFNGSSDASNG